ncbi:hypothetical protein SAMN06269185_1656 [Natronoarchaeum philippinense]|uniref:Uncharacterized protein n=1 Tax=Natronoarchaeum philippinense TaxID=558529 RepID=A0A285NS65_NATPI|nr:hypothetical protein [Natronoarchaeum philippinense]SNZ12364.1 hypothetical protein SAMN06269185_1656 [Natronoarchaeum philippinense]
MSDNNSTSDTESTDIEEMYDALNEADVGDVVDLELMNQHGEQTGGGVFRIDEKVHEFGDGKIICRNDVDDRVHLILEEVEYTSGAPIFIEEKGENWFSYASVYAIYD